MRVLFNEPMMNLCSSPAISNMETTTKCTTLGAKKRLPNVCILLSERLNDGNIRRHLQPILRNRIRVPPIGANRQLLEINVIAYFPDAADTPTQTIMHSAQPINRRIWRGCKPGKISDLHLVTDELPPPAAGEIQVAVKAVGLNFADVFTCLGLYSASPKGVYTPGLEFAGVVGAVGENVHGLLEGDRVVGLTRFGAYASHINVGHKYLRPFPNDWSFAEAAAYPVQALTMFYALRELGNVQEGHTVLIHSAAGGCGTFALGISKQLKAKVVATVGTHDKVKHLVDYWGADFLPYEQIIVRKGGGAIFKEQLLSSLSSLGVDGFDCIIDAVAGDYFKPGYELLTRGGRHVVYGAANFTPIGDKPNWLSLAWKFIRRPVIDPMQMMSDNKSVMAFNLIWMFDKVEKMERMFEGLEQLNLRPPLVGHTFQFSQALEALRTFQSGKTTGKVVLELE